MFTIYIFLWWIIYHIKNPSSFNSTIKKWWFIYFLNNSDNILLYKCKHYTNIISEIVIYYIILIYYISLLFGKISVNCNIKNIYNNKIYINIKNIYNK